MYWIHTENNRSEGSIILSFLNILSIIILTIEENNRSNNRVADLY